jgi:hypothetical protein
MLHTYDPMFHTYDPMFYTYDPIFHTNDPIFYICDPHVRNLWTHVRHLWTHVRDFLIFVKVVTCTNDCRNTHIASLLDAYFRFLFVLSWNLRKYEGKTRHTLLVCFGHPGYITHDALRASREVPHVAQYIRSDITCWATPSGPAPPTWPPVLLTVRDRSPGDDTWGGEIPVSSGRKSNSAVHLSPSTQRTATTWLHHVTMVTRQCLEHPGRPSDHHDNQLSYTGTSPWQDVQSAGRYSTISIFSWN